MIRIAYVINYIVKNGPSSVILNLIRHLDRTEYEISLITLFPGSDEKVLEELRCGGIVVYECSTLSRIGCLCGQGREFADIAARGRFDILHTHGLVPDILSSRLHLPMKKITTIHNNMYEDYPAGYGYTRSHVFIWLHLAALRKMDRCICCSGSVLRVMRPKLNNACCIRNGIQPVQARTAAVPEELGIPKGSRVFLYAGVLSAGKNVVWLIEQFVRYHKENEYLLVLGKGEKEAECRQKADSHVKLLGFRPDPISYMNISDVYVSASGSEGFSISVLEALSCGLTLFLSDIPSHREVIEMAEHIYSGEVFGADDFEQKLEHLRSTPADRDAIMVFQRRALSAEGMAHAYQAAYQESIGR